MPDITSASSGPGTANPGAGQTDRPSNRPGDGAVDPFETLFKMSRTAGLGSGDYVAVNATAIAAILLGLASALVLFRSPILMVIPAIGVVCAVLSFIQIARSNGTQTGREVAAIGLLLSLGLGGFVGYGMFATSLRNDADQKKIGALVQRLGRDIAAGDPKSMADAYDLCDEAFKRQVSPELFTARWAQNHHSPMFGELTAMETSGIFNFDDDQVSNDRLADTLVNVRFTNSGNTPFQVRMVFRQIGQSWKLDQTDVFPPPKATDKKPSAPGPVLDGKFGPSPVKPTTAPTP